MIQDDTAPDISVVCIVIFFDLVMQSASWDI